MSNKYIFIFAITVFILLSITGPGIFLNDEWIVGQQMNQLSQGHQITYNEGKYGYFMNGTPNKYIEARKNILTYPIALPLVSLPFEIIFSLLGSYTRFAIIVFWIILGYYCLYNIKDGRLSDISIILFTIIAALSMIIYSNFEMSGKYIPYEIISIVFTNVLLMGIFSVTTFKISELLFTDKNKQIVGWIATLSCTSLLFWAGTLKDHVLLSTIIILLCYFQIYYHKNQNSENLNTTYIIQCWVLSWILAGISLWIRPEVGIFIIVCLLIFNFIYTSKNISVILTELFFTFVGSLPMFINNQIVTGDFLKNPVLMASDISNSGTIIEELTTTSFVKLSYIISVFDLSDLARTFVAPLSGSIGLIVPLCLFIFTIISIIKYRQKLSIELKFILLVGFGSIFYYLLYASSTMQKDGGIVPDIRYFTPSYALFTLFALSIIPYELNYKKIIRYIFLFLPIIIIISLVSISSLNIGGTYQSFGILPASMSLLVLFFMILALINDRDTIVGFNPSSIIEILVPLSIVIPLMWQSVIIFIYHSSKIISYPMFIPVSEFLYKFMFGG